MDVNSNTSGLLVMDKKISGGAKSLVQINQSMANTRRRQLPQIPLDKQRENRDKGINKDTYLYVFSLSKEKIFSSKM